MRGRKLEAGALGLSAAQPRPGSRAAPAPHAWGRSPAALVLLPSWEAGPWSVPPSPVSPGVSPTPPVPPALSVSTWRLFWNAPSHSGSRGLSRRLPCPAKAAQRGFRECCSILSTPWHCEQVCFLKSRVIDSDGGVHVACTVSVCAQAVRLWSYLEMGSLQIVESGGKVAWSGGGQRPRSGRTRHPGTRTGGAAQAEAQSPPAG